MTAPFLDKDELKRRGLTIQETPPPSPLVQSLQNLLHSDPIIPVIRCTAGTSTAKINKTEAEYLARLEAMKRAGEILEIYGHQSLKFQVGLDRCFYSPDFPVMTPTGLEMHEVKGGHVWDDARVKFQACALRYRFCRWVWAQKKQGVWTIEKAGG